MELKNFPVWGLIQLAYFIWFSVFTVLSFSVGVLNTTISGNTSLVTDILLPSENVM